MSMLIHQFLAAATGPSKLRSDLRRRTQSVRVFFNALDGITTVGAEVPPSIRSSGLIGEVSQRAWLHALRLQGTNFSQPEFHLLPDMSE